MTGFVQSLLNATKEDYDQLVNDIDTREKELATYIDTRQKEIASLRAAAQVIGIRLGIVKEPHHGGRVVAGYKPVAADKKQQTGDVDPPEAPPGTAKTEHYRGILKQFIQANGPQTMSELSRKTGIPNGSMTAVLSHPMFVKTAIGYGLTENHK
jgi:hypothetical protein